VVLDDGVVIIFLRFEVCDLFGLLDLDDVLRGYFTVEFIYFGFGEAELTKLIVNCI
jgi:hypothetical protein